nr:tropomyosin-like [Physcomitrium patens]|eukprot:XP_024366518.1 tropomyosin-like [Physcomitrella patens]
MVHELQDSDELSKDLENQKKLVATQQKTIAELEEKLAEKVTKYTELEVRLNKMEKDWQMDRMLHQAAEDLSKQERDLARTQLQESLEKCAKLEKDHQQMLLEVATIQDRIRNLEAELDLTRQPVSTSNSEEVAELKTKLDDHQKYIVRLEEQVRVLGFANEDLTEQLEKAEEKEEEEEIEEPNFQAQAPVETILLDELSEPTNADNQ